MGNDSFNQEKCLECIYYVAKLKKISIKEVEQQAGLSQGYFSRLRKSDKESKLAVQTLEKVAKILGVSLYGLIDAWYLGARNEAEMDYSDFVGKLITETGCDVILWEDVNKFPLDYGGEIWESPFARSTGFNGQFSSCKKAKLDEDKTVYVVEIYAKDKNSSFINYEFYLEYEGRIIPIFDVAGENVSRDLYDNAAEVYFFANEQVERVLYTPDKQKLIREYLGR